MKLNKIILRISSFGNSNKFILIILYSYIILMSSEEVKISKSIKNVSNNYENYKDKINKDGGEDKIKNIEKYLEKEFQELNTIVDFEKMEQKKKNKFIKKYLSYKEYLFLKENANHNKLITDIKLQKFKMIVENIRKQAKQQEDDKKIINILKKHFITIIITIISQIVGSLILIYLTKKMKMDVQNGGKKKTIQNNLKFLSKYNYSTLEDISKDVEKLSLKSMNKREIKSLLNKCDKLKDKVPKMRLNSMIQTLSYTTSLLGLVKLQD